MKHAWGLVVALGLAAGCTPQKTEPEPQPLTEEKVKQLPGGCACAITKGKGRCLCSHCGTGKGTCQCAR